MPTYKSDISIFLHGWVGVLFVTLTGNSFLMIEGTVLMDNCNIVIFFSRPPVLTCSHFAFYVVGVINVNTNGEKNMMLNKNYIILREALNWINGQSRIITLISFLIRLQSQGDMGTRKQEVDWFNKRHSN